MKLTSEKYLPHLLILLFSFLLYGNTLSYDYTLDDLIVIKDNAFTKKGLAGIGDIFSYDSFTGFFGVEKKLVAGGRYRPLSIASFAVEYGLMGGLNPFVSHLINILLYALTGCLIYLILKRLLNKPASGSWMLRIPFITALLFLAHPVHTEVVANIKGRDEIFALLFSLLTLWHTLRFFDSRKPLQLALANIAFFLGLLSKENAILFLVVVPLTIYFFTGTSLRRNLSAAASLLGTAVIFVFIRFLVLGYINSGELPRELLNNPFLYATTGEKFGTILYTLGLYLKLMIFPYVLTHDYYPYHIPLVSFTDWRSLIPLAIYLSMIVFALITLKKKSIFSYGILFYLLTLFIVSNLLFPVGTFMNERFIYMPSFGLLLIAAYLLADRLPAIIKNSSTAKYLTTSLLTVVLVLLTLRTYTRNQAWKDNFTLFTTDVKISENSIKVNVSAGGDYSQKAAEEPDSLKKAEYYELSVKYLEKAIRIYPKTVNGLVLYGNVLTMYRKDYKEAINQYFKVLEFDPYNQIAYKNVVQVLGSLDNARETAYKISILRRLYSINPDNGDMNYSLGKLYGQFRGNADSASFFLEKALVLSPENIAVYKDLGIVYSMKGEYGKALDIFTRGSKIDPNDAQIRQNMMITMQILNQQRR